MSPTTVAKHPDDTSFSTIARLAWPQLLMTVTHFFVGFVDVLVAGMLDRDVQASMGLISQCLFFFLVVGMAVANGSVAAVSQSLGAGLARRASRYIGFSLLLGLAFSTIFLAVGQPFKNLLLDLLQVPQEIEPITRYFLHIYLFVLPAYYLLVVTNALFRATKRVHIPMFAMLIVTVVNTIGDFGLGLGMWGMPDMGFKGLAWSTFGSVAAGAIFNLIMLWRYRMLSLRSFPPLRWMKKGWRYLFKVAWPSGAMQVIWQMAYIFLFAVVGALPVDAVNALAGMTTGLRIEAILFMPAFAFNMTASILVGHLLGQGKPAQAKTVGYRILGIAVAAISTLGVVLWQFVPEISTYLAADAAVQAQAQTYLYYNIAAIPFTVTSMVLGGIMSGAGATIYTMVVYGGASWGIRLPLAYVLGHLLFRSSEGVWVAMLISQLIQSSTMLYCFQFRNWTRYSMMAKRMNRINRVPQGA